MKRWSYRALLSLFILQGCATSDALKTASVAERNIDNLARLNLGMSETQVMRIMRDPMREESFEFSEDKYDVWFYVTQITVMSQTRMVPLNLTPLTFKNKILVGKGYDYYHWLTNKSIEQKKSKSAPENNKIEKSVEQATSFNLLSMSSPKKTEKELADPPPPSAPAEKEKKPPPQDKNIQMDEKDEQMIEDEQDQNFNFW